MEPERGREWIEHTADAGVRAYAPTFEALLEELAGGMFEVITDLSLVRPVLEFHSSVQADSPEDLVVAWLSELLYLHETKGVLLSEFSVRVEEGWRLKAVSRGEKLDRKRHELRALIKAVTYHGLVVAREDGRWTAAVIFDV